MVWNKGLTIEDLRVRKNIERRNATMLKKYGTLVYNPEKKGCFKKGHIPWIKGKHHSEETKKKISIANTKKILSKFGFTSHLYHHKNGGWYLKIYSQAQILRFRDTIGFRLPRKKYNWR